MQLDLPTYLKSWRRCICECSLNKFKKYSVSKNFKNCHFLNKLFYWSRKLELLICKSFLDHLKFFSTVGQNNFQKKYHFYWVSKFVLILLFIIRWWITFEFQGSLTFVGAMFMLDISQKNLLSPQSSTAVYLSLPLIVFTIEHLCHRR